MAKLFSIRDTIELTAGATGISMILGGWLYVDSHFASAKDLGKVAVTLEQSLMQLRIDVLEDRIDRELEKPEINKRRIEKMKSQIRRLESRHEALTNKEMQ